jgi:hypothetical protein
MKECVKGLSPIFSTLCHDDDVDDDGDDVKKRRRRRRRRGKDCMLVVLQIQR